jgi:2-phosphosulfolactate phosphatase
MLAGVTRWLDVALWPGEQARQTPDAVIVVDLFRATTTIATLFSRGLRRLTACADITLARELRDETNAILFGEVRGLPPGDFDYGNSPVEAATLDIEGRDAVLFTTNGTAALVLSAPESRVYAGSLANISALAREVSRLDSVRIVCAGNDGGRRVSLEDALGAGLIALAIVELSAECTASDNAALVIAATAGDDTLPRILGSQHAITLRELGLDHDMEFALERDSSSALPIVTGWGEDWARLENIEGEREASSSS